MKKLAISIVLVALSGAGVVAHASGLGDAVKGKLGGGDASALSLGGLYLGESLGQIGIFVIFITVLLFRPQGLFGAKT